MDVDCLTQGLTPSPALHAAGATPVTALAAWLIGGRSGVHQEGDDVTVQTYLSNKYHVRKSSILLVTSRTGRNYEPKTSAKMRIRIIPTKRRGCCAVPRTPASPTIPIANLDIMNQQRSMIQVLVKPIDWAICICTKKDNVPCSQAGKTDSQTSAKLDKALVEREFLM